MFCSNCGKEIDDKAVVCVHCGAATHNFNPKASQVLSDQPGYDWLTTLLLCFFVGVFGVHNFYVKKTTYGLIQLFTLGGCGIWALIDLILIITGSFKDAEGRPLVRRNI